MKRKILLSIFCIIATYVSRAQTADTTRIRLLLEKESATWRSGDVQAHADCWKLQPYGKILISTAEGKFLDIPVSVMINPPAGMMGKGGSSENSHYNFSLHDNTAWVSHDEMSTTADGSKNYTSEVRFLEKIDGQWKLVGESIHAYKK